jgi:predicted enzyme related to lactoylglutathione lyase
MAHLLGPDFIALQVSDLSESRDFYVDVLGLVEAPQSPDGAVLFDTRPIPFAIRKPRVDLSASTRLGWGVSLWINCDDADGLHAKLVDAGTPITQPPTDGPFGRQFGFRDPDGYAIVVHAVT